MRGPTHQLLRQAAARLHADGHYGLAADVLQLARQWTPEQVQEMIGHLPPNTNEPTD